MSKKLHQKALVIALLFTITSTYSQVGIGTTTPDPDAALEIDSATGGILLPRVSLSSTTSPSPLSANVAGMLVYNTNSTGDVTPGFYCNDGTDWARLDGASTASDWAPLGNAGTNPATDFVGTTDAQDVVLARNSTPKIRVLSTYTGFTDEIRIKDGAPNSGNNLVILDDDGGSNDGRIRIFRNNQAQHIIDGNGHTVFNEKSKNFDFRVESNTATDGLFLEGSNGQVTFGNYGGGSLTGTATYMLAVDVDGNIVEEALPMARMSSSAGLNSHIGLGLQGGAVGDRGTAKLINGEAFIGFSKEYQQQIANDKPIIVTVSPMGETKGLYIVSTSERGFKVKENANGISNASFNWIAIADKKK